MAWNWNAVDWADPDGGTIRLFPHIPATVLPRGLRPRDDWDGLALLLHEEERASWADEERLEKSSKGSATTIAIEGGGDLSRMLIRMQLVDGVQTPRFPDPEPRRLLNLAEKGGQPAYFVEPGVDDAEWLTYLEECADEASRLPRMIGSLFARRRFAKEWKKAQPSVSEPQGTSDPEGLALCAGVAAAWWRRCESLMTEELRERRNQRLSSGLRGALADLRGSKVDPVLIVPVFQDWLDDLLATLNTNPDPESSTPVGAR